LTKRSILAPESERSTLRKLQVGCVVDGELVLISELGQLRERQAGTVVVDARAQSREPAEGRLAFGIGQFAAPDEDGERIGDL
jgi:hypothetical protein